MAKLSDLIAATDAAVDAAIARVNTDEAADQAAIEALRVEVARLQEIIENGDASPEQEAAFAALKEKLDGLEAASVPA
jgi:hypothetical protein